MPCIALSAPAAAPSSSILTWKETRLALAASWEGDCQEFGNALLEVGWLHENGTSYVLHEWQVYGGQIFQRREKWRENKWQQRHQDENPKEEAEAEPPWADAGAEYVDEQAEAMRSYEFGA